MAMLTGGCKPRCEAWSALSRQPLAFIVPLQNGQQFIRAAAVGAAIHVTDGLQCVPAFGIFMLPLNDWKDRSQGADTAAAGCSAAASASVQEAVHSNAV